MSKNVVKRDTTVLYYDCTNYFFETEQADPVMAEKMGVEKIVVCTDGGLSSEDNRSYNSTADRSFITVRSLKKLNDVYAEWALSTKGWKLIPRTEAERTGAVMNKLRCDDNEPELEFDLTEEDTARYYADRTFYRERWILKEKTGFSQRLIVTFSFKYRDYLRALRSRQIERDAKIAAKSGINKKQRNAPGRYVTETFATKDGEVAIFKVAALNLDAIADDEKYDGFYGICTDLNNPVKEIIELNHNRWESEDCFRVLKTDFKARPVFVRSDNHIKAHFITCFISLLIFRILECRLKYKYTAPEIIAALRGMTLNIIPGEGYRPNFTRTDLTDSLHEIAGFRTDTEIVTNQKIKQIIRGIKDCQD